MTILETVIAASLIAVAIVAALSLSTNTQKETAHSRDVSLATKHNTAAVDWLKRLRAEQGWLSFVNEISADGGDVLYCLNTLPTAAGFAALTPTTASTCAAGFIPGTDNFYRTVELTLANPPEYLDILATTYFGTPVRSVTTETRLTNY